MLALLSLIFGGISAAAITHLFAQRRADREHRLKKLEELCLALDSHANWVTRWVTEMATFKFPKKDPAENPSLAGDTQFYSTLTMLTQIYFPELIPALESIDGLKNEAIDRYAQIFQLKPRTLSEQQCRMDLIESAHQSITLHFEFRRKLFEIANRTRDGGLITWIKDSFHVN